MTPSRRARAPLASALVFAIVAVACGGSAPSTSTSPDPTLSPTRSPAPSPSTMEPSPLPVETAPPAATVEPVATTGRIVDASNGYTITLPDGWVRIDLTEQDIEAAVRIGFDAISPEAAELLVEQVSAMSAAGIKLFAIDEDGATLELVPNVSIAVIPSAGLALGLLEHTIVAQLRNALPTLEGEIESERLALPAGESLRIAYDIGTGEAAGGQSVRVQQYLIVGETSGYFVTVTGASTPEFVEEALEIASTFEFIE